MVDSNEVKTSQHITILCKGIAVTISLILIISLSVQAQQSTTGPEPPPNIDQGLREPNKAQVIIPGVPSYIWHHGCGPTAVGMVVGYWDSNGFPDLVDGDASTQTSGANAMMSDDNDNPICNDAYSDHYRDYSCPEDSYPNMQQDKSTTGGAHASNCVADFMQTSWSSENNYYGWSWYSAVPMSFTMYVDLIAPTYDATATNLNYYIFSWEDYMAEIDAGKPIVLLVDTDGSGGTDHFVPAIGYDNSTMEYCCYNTWDHSLHWFQWRELNSGNTWGIYGATIFDLSIIDDIDGDGIDDGDDNCPATFNPLQEDTDFDNIGDSCDNCPSDYNPLQEDADLDGIGDVCESCCNHDGIRGDVTGDPGILVDDLTFLVDYIFKGGSEPDCYDEGDANGSGQILVDDLTLLVDYLFKGGPPPADCP